MGFDDLEKAERDREEQTAESSAPESESTADSTPVPEQSQTAAEPEASERDPDGGPSSAAETVSDEPAFEYEDVEQSPMYARPAAWNALNDALDLEVVRALREAGLRNEEKRELHDAALRVAADHPEEIAQAVAAARRGDE